MFERTEPDSVLVRALLAEQHPSLADLELRHVGSGWDNHMFRLGDDLMVRVPCRQTGAELIAHEIRWLPELALRLPLPIPAPLHIGVPSGALDFPWAWTIGPWIEGTDGLSQPMHDEVSEATRLGDFLQTLHTPAPADAPKNPHRGMPLVERDERTRAAIATINPTLIDRQRLTERWEQACAASPHDGPPVWLHGDLHPANVVLHEGELAAIIDFGDITSGDPACDLAIAHTLFTDTGRTALHHALDVDDACWLRAEGWALSLCLAYQANPDGHPDLAQRGIEVLQRLSDVSRSPQP